MFKYVGMSGLSCGVNDSGRFGRTIKHMISFAGQIERGEAMPSVEMLQLIITELDLDPRALFFDEKVEVNEYTELCLIMRRMSTQQRKLVLDFARMLRSYKLL